MSIQCQTKEAFSEKIIKLLPKENRWSEEYASRVWEAITALINMDIRPKKSLYKIAV